MSGVKALIVTAMKVTINLVLHRWLSAQNVCSSFLFLSTVRPLLRVWFGFKFENDTTVKGCLIKRARTPPSISPLSLSRCCLQKKKNPQHAHPVQQYIRIKHHYRLPPEIRQLLSPVKATYPFEEQRSESWPLGSPDNYPPTPHSWVDCSGSSSDHRCKSLRPTLTPGGVGGSLGDGRGNKTTAFMAVEDAAVGGFESLALDWGKSHFTDHWSPTPLAAVHKSH